MAEALKRIKVPREMYRQVPIENLVRIRAEEGDEGGADRYELTFASEIPVRRENWWTGEIWYEILSHNPEDVDLSRAEEGLPFLQSHERMIVLGSLTDVAVGDDRRSHAILGFSSIPVATDQKTLVDEGHVKTVSVGYSITGMELESKDENDVATYRCKWMPYEVSLEPIPADFGVGIGRARGAGGARSEDEALIEFVVDEPGGGERTMAAEKKSDVVVATPPGSPESAAPEVRVERNVAAEAAEISELAHNHNMGERVAGWIRDGLTPDQVGRVILSEVGTKPRSAPAAEELTDLPDKDRRAYSVTMAIRQQTELKSGGRSQYDGLEGEIHTELSRLTKGEDHGGIRVPWRLKTREELEILEARALGTTEATGGAALVGTTYGDMIDMLKNQTLCISHGCRVLPGLQGVLQFPRKDNAPTVYWTEENPASDVAVSQPDYGYVLMSAKTLIGGSEIPRQLVAMAQIDVEADIRMELASGHALALDYGALHGLGADKEPVGIWNTPNVLTQAMAGVPTFALITNATAKVADANAAVGALGWMLTPLLAGVLMTKPKVGTTMPIFIYEGTFADGTIGGYKAGATNQISKTLGAGSDEHGMIFGNWNDLTIGIWGNDLEIVVDPFTKAKKGQLVITSFSMADAAVMRPGSFCKGTGAKLA